MLSTMMLAYPKNVTINADSRPAEKGFRRNRSAVGA